MIRTGTLAFLSGILLLLCSSTLPPAALIYLLVPLALLLFVMDLRLRLAGCMLCGFIWALFSANDILTTGLSPDLESKTLTLTGHVVSLPELQADGIRFEYQVDHPVLYAGENWSAPGKIRLSWYQHPPEVLPGQYWELTVRLKRGRMVL